MPVLARAAVLLRAAQLSGTICSTVRLKLETRARSTDPRTAQTCWDADADPVTPWTHTHTHTRGVKDIFVNL